MMGFGGSSANVRDGVGRVRNAANVPRAAIGYGMNARAWAGGASTSAAAPRCRHVVARCHARTPTRVHIEPGCEGVCYGGACTLCGGHHVLAPTPAALAAAQHVAAMLDAHGRLDYEVTTHAAARAAAHRSSHVSLVASTRCALPNALTQVPERDAHPDFSTDFVWTKGPGRMLGVLLCAPANEAGSSGVMGAAAEAGPGAEPEQGTVVLKAFRWGRQAAQLGALVRVCSRVCTHARAAAAHAIAADALLAHALLAAASSPDTGSARDGWGQSMASRTHTRST